MSTLTPNRPTAALACGLVLTACAGEPRVLAQSPRSASLVEVPVPEAQPSGVEVGSAGERLPRAERLERKDPLEYFVGTWDGLAFASNHSQGWQTVLVVDGYGSFSVRHESPHGKVCELFGKLLPGPDSVRLDVTDDNCNPQRIGALERPILSKTADEFVLRAPEYGMTFHYTRRPTPPGD